MTIKRHHPARRIWKWTGLAVVLLLGISLYILDRTLGEHLRRVKASDTLGHQIDGLVLTTPDGLTDEEWAAAVLWTHNLHGNSLVAFDLELQDIRRLQTELEERARNGADMATIEWLWDRYASLTPGGQRYNQRFRATMLEYVAFARSEGHKHGDYLSFRDYVRERGKEGANSR